MTRYRPGRLRRILNPIIGASTPLTNVTTTSYAVADDEIHSISIARGNSSGRNVGYHPSTCEISLDGRYDANDSSGTMRVQLNMDAATALGSYLGLIGPDNIYHRYTGRIGRITVEDTGRDRFTTTMAAAGHLAMMNYSQHTAEPYDQRSVPGILHALTDSANPARGVDFDFTTNIRPVNFRKHGTDDPVTFRDGIGPYAEEIGIMIQERRDGTTRAYSHFSREDLAVERHGLDWPLMRAQAIAPGSYEQAADTPPKIVRWKVHNESGQLVTRTVELPNSNEEYREIEEIDWSKWVEGGGESQLRREARARARLASDRHWSLPSITVDLLLLLRKGDEYSRRIAGQILTMEAGRPVYLSGDWPLRARGTHFAEGITETIGPNEWTVELSLVPYPSAIGETIGPVPAFAWDSAIDRWNDDTREWNQA